MRRHMRGVRAGTPGEAAQVQELRHARAVIDGIVVPQKRFSIELLADALQMTRAEFARTDFLAGPEHFDLGIERLAEIFQIVLRSLAEDAIQQRIVRVIGRANDQPCGFAVRLHEMRNLDLVLRKVRKIAAHVVEQQGEIVEADGIERGELACQTLAFLGVEVAEDVERTETYAETHAQRAAMRGKLFQLIEFGLRMILRPALAQEVIELRRIDIEAIAMRLQERRRFGAVLPAPRFSVISLDNSERRAHHIFLLTRI